MRVAMCSALVVVLAVTGSSVNVRAEGSAFRTSMEATANAYARGQAAADAAASAYWNRVVNLNAGRRLVIRTRDGQVVRGTFVDADDVSLNVRTGTVRRGFARAEVTVVTSDPKGSPAGAYVGGLLGCLVGSALGAGLTRQCRGFTEGDNAVAGLACAGTAIGFGFAGYYGLRVPAEVIYHAP